MQIEMRVNARKEKIAKKYHKKKRRRYSTNKRSVSNQSQSGESEGNTQNTCDGLDDEGKVEEACPVEEDVSGLNNVGFGIIVLNYVKDFVLFNFMGSCLVLIGTTV